MVETIVRGHLKGDRNYTNELHKVLTLELFHRQLLDSQNVNLTKRSTAAVGATAHQ
jgi:hypothetical protein